VVPAVNSTVVITSGVCIITGLTSAMYTFPVAGSGTPLWSSTTYSTSSCGAADITSGPEYNYGTGQACDSTGLALTMVNGPLQYCTSNCNSNCQNIPTGSCQSGSGIAGGEIYYSNGVGAQAVVTYATAALIAVAAIVLSL